jgi:hypothetical protein
MINQITVFLENEKGRLASMTSTLAAADINMMSLCIVEATEYGLVRIICANPDKAKDALVEAGFRAIQTPVAAISVPNEVGGLAKLMDVFDDLGLNIEYGYCFSYGNQAVDVFKVNNLDEQGAAIVKLEAAGFKMLSIDDLC